MFSIISLPTGRKHLFYSSSAPIHHLFVFIFIVLIISPLLFSSAQMITPTTWSSTAVSGNQIYRVCSTTTKTYCYKSYFGNFYFFCVNDANHQYIELYQCGNSSCTSGNCRGVTNFTVANQVASVLDGNRKLNWTGRLHTASAGVISETGYDTTSTAEVQTIIKCNDTLVKYRQFYVNAVDACIPWVPFYHYASQRRFCLNSSQVAVHAKYLNSGNCANGSTSTNSSSSSYVDTSGATQSLLEVQFDETNSGECSDDGDLQIECDSTTATIAVFDRSGVAGLVVRSIVVVMMLVIFLLC